MAKRKAEEIAADDEALAGADVPTAGFKSAPEVWASTVPGYPPAEPALVWTVHSTCGRARNATLKLPHGEVKTPVFMPVGTQGTIKGLTSEDVAALNCQIILGNTFHLGNRPTTQLLEKAGGLHKFMNWKGNILTDSGGFQMVSLLALAQITEEGVEFEDPKSPGCKSLLTPEESIHYQNQIGSDIMMALDDVVSSTLEDMDRVKEATVRTTRWIDRCIKANKNPSTQNLFGIVQGHLDPGLRTYSLKELIRRDLPGYAIGGLSGGEGKDKFWRVVEQCTRPEGGLPANKPRYLMGVGYSLDLVVCVALGVDMFDCVYPCRTARFGTALTRTGQLRLTGHEFAADLQPIAADCTCETCRTYSRAVLHTLVTKEPVASSLITIHNISFLMQLMSELREAIAADALPAYVRNFLKDFFPLATPSPSAYCPPRWVKHALDSVGITTDDLFDWKSEDAKELPDMPHHHSRDKKDD